MIISRTLLQEVRQKKGLGLRRGCNFLGAGWWSWVLNWPQMVHGLNETQKCLKHSELEFIDFDLSSTKSL